MNKASLIIPFDLFKIKNTYIEIMKLCFTDINF